MKYRANTGLNYPDPKGKPDPKTGVRPEKRVEAGEVVDDIPAKSIGWLLEGGLIEPVDEAPAAKAKPQKAEG